MRTSEYYGVQVPELGDRADITVVSQAIIDSEDNQSGKVENMKATLSGSTISLVSESRTDKLVKYYNGLAVQFISPVNAQAGTAYKIKVDNLVEQPYNNKVDIKVGDIVQAIYGGTGFVSANTPIPRSSSTSSSSEVTVATSLAVKNANDNANTRALKTTQIIAGNGLIGGGALNTNRTINVVSADDSIVVGANNIKVNTYNGVDSTSTTKPASANAVKQANDNANGRYPHIKYTSLQDVNNIKTSGIYSFAVTPTNAGTSTHGTLIVDSNVGTPYQIWIPDISHIFYKRKYISGKWEGWSTTLDNSISGNANTATVLATARTINGTSFNGSANITTATWGTARTLTIGNRGKSVNGSANVSWSLSEIGVYSKSEVDSKISAICPYKVGDIFLTTNATNPSTVWLGTTWQKIEGRMLLGTSGSGASKATGGSNTVTLSTANLPSHTHSASQSAHTHSRGTQNITGTFSPSSWNSGSGASGAFSFSSSNKYNPAGNITYNGSVFSFTASNSWSGASSSAQPAVTVSATGSGSAFSILSSYYTVHMWLRTA